MTHQEIEAYNWDDGLAPIWPVVDDARTETATALLIYWRLEGPYLSERTPEIHGEAWRMNNTVRSRIVAGFYVTGSLRYDPVADGKINRLQLRKLEMAGVEPVLLGRQEST